jgi:hypothetical protein
MRRIVMVTLAGVLTAGLVHADIRTEERTQMRFEGGLGRLLNLFGGRSTRDGVVNKVAIKGDRKMTVTGDSGQLVDLAEEKVYDIDFKNKSYRVTTFAEIIQQMQEARKRAADQQAKDTGQKPVPAPTPEQEKEKEPQYDVDFDLRESGQKRTINGFDAREVVMTVTVREKGKTLEESGGFVTTTNMWLADKTPAMQEVAEFERRYAEKLLGPALFDPQQMAAATAMYPMMSEAIGRMEQEKVNMNGTAMLTVTRFEAVADAATAKAEAQQKKEEPAPTGLGGLGARLARRALDRNKEQNADAAASQPGRATVMTFEQEVLKMDQQVADADVALPTGFRERR